MEQPRPRFQEREIVRLVDSAKTAQHAIVGFTGTVAAVHESYDGGWCYTVNIPRRRRQNFSMEEDELESTGTMAPPAPERPKRSLRLRVDPETGGGTALDESGQEIEVDDEDDELHGVPLFTWTEIVDPDADELDDWVAAVVIGKARRRDGGWRYVVLRLDDRVVCACDGEELDPTVRCDEGEFLDRERPAGLEELEREERLDFVAAWKAPRPAFGYDEGVRVLDRPHTAPVAGRTGSVRHHLLGDDLRWRYFVLFDDVAAEVQSATVAEEDLESTGVRGEGYNPPPDWLH
ncbi:MAG: Imm31 family immunity protein [Actinomycetota bacterium]|nr:Imm31 family immunity protein [Actinomycetota bacterium]